MVAQISALKSNRLSRSITNIGATKANSINALPALPISRPPAADLRR
jgi:hypothetical protein